jgi:tetratricopeptide (TPR) repeat protein
MENMTPEMINALVGLWKPIVALGFLIFVISYGKPLKELLANLQHLLVKKGDMEVRLDRKESVKEPVDAPLTGNSSEPQQVVDSTLPLLMDKTEPKDWLEAIITAFLAKKPEEAKAAFEKYKLSEIDSEKKLRNELVYAYLRYVHNNDQQAITDLQKSTEIEPIKSIAFYWLSQCYLHIRLYEKAKETVINSLDSASSEDAKADRSELLAYIMLDMGDSPENALKMILEAFKYVPSKEKQAPLYKALSVIFDKSNEPVLKAISAEKVIELTPDDMDQVFNAAYSQSQAELRSLSISNYDTLLRQNPENATIINNLGFEVSLVDMPIYAANYYKAAASKNLTLAMANLAFLNISVGLIEEAEVIIKTAQGQDDVHKNIAEATSKIAKLKDDEDKKWKETIQTGIKQKSFFQNFANARFNSQAEPGLFGGSWVLGKEKIEIVEDNGKISVEWGSGSLKRKLSGDLFEKSARVNIQKWNTASWVSLDKGYYEGGVSGFCYLSPDNRKMYLMGLFKDKPEFIELNRDN